MVLLPAFAAFALLAALVRGPAGRVVLPLSPAGAVVARRCGDERDAPARYGAARRVRARFSGAKSP
ncbi:hypothetical protein [Streptosporangium pseudovulgare]|uniref:Uncharacterized protein n=1 Tax=Streptosporangium pseudovulgare TaxID=35765 RepID=A0ABQ2R9A0_9ACTN|nr:hypothetical protein [Streptosporangium pseudovulgare]GGQ14192.1 hypothetical protein GCM10010140_50570 [Streptosporangium pseudovulgare]